MCGGLSSLAGLNNKIEQLFKQGEFGQAWKFYCTEEVEREQIWKWVGKSGEKDAFLVCTGKPFGYIRTIKAYSDFELTLEWKYPKNPNGNSGVLIHTTGEDKIWPTAIQVQLHGPTAGSIFPTDGATTENRVQVKDMKLPVNEWQRCFITCKDGTISVSINGKKTGEVTGCTPRKGTIALQSEDSEVHFRRIQLRKIK